MTYLLDTQIVLWISVAPERLSVRALETIQDPENQIYFSPISLVEIAIKRTRREGYLLPPEILRDEWLGHGYLELPLKGDQIVALDRLPTLHKDPFDRILLAQAIFANMILLTADDILVGYPSNVMDAR